MAPRTVRMLVVMDVEVRPHNWKAQQIEEAITALVAAVVSPAPRTGNLWIERYRVHTVVNAYSRLLDSA